MPIDCGIKENAHWPSDIDQLASYGGLFWKKLTNRSNLVRSFGLSERKFAQPSKGPALLGHTVGTTGYSCFRHRHR